MGRAALIILTLFIALASPMSVFAQFIPIEQAKEQQALENESAVGDVLLDINSKGDTARRQVQTLLIEAQSGRVGASATGRRIDTLLGKLKTDLNHIVNEYAKKSPPGNAVRAAHSAAQQTLDGIRRQSSEVLDQVGFDKAADPNALSGKYLRYQEKIKKLVDAGIAAADQRLQESGRRDTVRKELEKIIDDTQRKIEVSTTAFLTTNSEVLPSAIDRLKKEQLDLMSKEMAGRFKMLEGLSNDKALDLTPDELRIIEEAKKEMASIVDRALQTADSTMVQISNSGLPTSSDVAGVNPLLQAKFQSVTQVREMQRSALNRLAKINGRLEVDKELSANARSVFAREYEHEKNRLTDNLKEYLDYFTAGDPSKKKYKNEKERLQEQAAGCTDFFCNIGRVVAGVGSAIIQDKTSVLNPLTGRKEGGISIAPQAISGGLFGINDPNPSAVRGAYANRYGGYGATAGSGQFNNNQFGNQFGFGSQQFGGQLGGIDPRCYALGGFGTPPFNPNTSGGFFLPPPLFSNGSRAIVPPQSNLPSLTNDPLGYLKNLGTNYNLGQYVSNIFMGSQLTKLGINCHGGANQFGGLPGYGSIYGSVFGGYPVPQALGYQTNNVALTGINQTNYAQVLAQGLRLIEGSQGIDDGQKKVFTEVVSILDAKGIADAQKIPLVLDKLRTTNFFRIPGTNSDPIVNIFNNLCLRALGDPNLSRYCQNYIKELVDTSKPRISLPGSVPPPVNSDLTNISEYISFVKSYRTGTPSDACIDSNLELVQRYRTNINNFTLQYNTNINNNPTVVQRLREAQGLVNGFIRLCQQYKNSVAPPAVPLDPKVVTINQINGYIRGLQSFVEGKTCSPESLTYNKTILVDTLSSDISFHFQLTPNPPEEAALIAKIDTLRRLIAEHLKICATTTKPTASTGASSTAATISNATATVLVRQEAPGIFYFRMGTGKSFAVANSAPREVFNNFGSEDRSVNVKSTDETGALNLHYVLISPYPDSSAQNYLGFSFTAAPGSNCIITISSGLEATDICKLRFRGVASMNQVIKE